MEMGHIGGHNGNLCRLEDVVTLQAAGFDYYPVLENMS